MSKLAVKPRRRGRPTRSAIDPIRTAIWASTLWPPRLACTQEEIRGICEAIGCAEPARQSARWYKYLHGLTTPSQKIVSAVAYWRPNSSLIFNHPLWDLIAHPALSPDELRGHVLRLEEFSDLIADRKMPSDALSTFWRRPDLDHRVVLKRVMKTYEEEQRPRLRHYLGMMGVIVALIHDAEHRQRQVQHFEVHCALGQTVLLVADSNLRLGPWFGKVETLLIDRWLSTDYTNPTARSFLRKLNATDQKEAHRYIDAEQQLPQLQSLNPSRSRWALELLCQQRIQLNLPSDT